MIRVKTTAIVAPRHRPAPTATPVAATIQIDAAVVRPCTDRPAA